MCDLWYNGYDVQVDLSMQYVWQAGNTQDKEKLREAIREAVPIVTEENIMNIAELFKEDVRIRAENRGMEKGQKETKLEMARKMLTKHYTVAEVAELTGLSEAEVGRLGQ